MSAPKNKYRKGFIIFDLNTLIWDHLDKGHWVYLRDKVIHPSIILNMSLMTVKQFIDARNIREAIDQKKEYYVKKQEEYISANLH